MQYIKNFHTPTEFLGPSKYRAAAALLTAGAFKQLLRLPSSGIESKSSNFLLLRKRAWQPIVSIDFFIDSVDLFIDSVDFFIDSVDFFIYSVDFFIYSSVFFIYRIKFFIYSKASHSFIIYGLNLTTS